MHARVLKFHILWIHYECFFSCPSCRAAYWFTVCIENWYLRFDRYTEANVRVSNFSLHETSACTMSAILKKKILSGISFTKINKNCPNYPLKVHFIGYQNAKEPIRDRFTKRHPHDVSIGSPNRMYQNDYCRA